MICSDLVFGVDEGRKDETKMESPYLPTLARELRDEGLLATKGGQDLAIGARQVAPLWAGCCERWRRGCVLHFTRWRNSAEKSCQS